MTELQVIALQNLSTGLASFHRDHILIAAGSVTLGPDDTYDRNKVEEDLRAVDDALRALCRDGGRSDLYGAGIPDV